MPPTAASEVRPRGQRIRERGPPVENSSAMALVSQSRTRREPPALATRMLRAGTLCEPHRGPLGDRARESRKLGHIPLSVVDFESHGVGEAVVED